MKYLVTGGAGFIGANLVDTLVKQGNEVRVVDGTVRSGSAMVMGQAGVDFLNEDIADWGFMREVCKGIDTVIHLAAHSGVVPSVRNPRLTIVNNVVGLSNILESARLHSVRKFILASSGAVLGEQTVPLHEEMLPKPKSPYAATKLAGEALCHAYYASYGLETVALRFSNVYGPYAWHKNNLIPNYIKSCLRKEEKFTIFGDGFQTRDFIYVDDLIRMLLGVTEKDALNGEVLHVSTGVGTAILSVISHLQAIAEDIVGHTPSISFEEGRKGEVRYSSSSTTLSGIFLGDLIKTPLEEGLQKTFEWFGEIWG